MTSNDKIEALKEAIRILEECDAQPNVTTCRKTINGLTRILADLDGDPPERPKSFVVKALVRSDDENVSDYVEASDWLTRLNNESLASLCEDCGSNEITDDLYWELDGEIGDNDWGFHVAARLGRYLNAINESNARETIGFSVRLDEDDLHMWVQKNRPKAWKQYKEENS